MTWSHIPSSWPKKTFPQSLDISSVSMREIAYLKDALQKGWKNYIKYSDGDEN